MGKLEGKVALITGASKGIGAAVAKRFMEDDIGGMVLLARGEAAVKALAAELDPTGERVIGVRCDISKKEDCVAAVQAALEKFGTIDILVNNAGITQDKIFHKMTDEQWFNVLNVNLNGVYFMTREVVPIMREKAYGRIVNISSTSAYGNAGQANYAASKGAINSLTKTLAREEGPKNITVNAIAPGFIKTDMYMAVPQENIDAAINSRIQLKRLGEPSELAAAVAFLASDDASFITGQILIVNGGAPIG